MSELNGARVTHQSISKPNNIFNLVEPDSYNCSIERYKAGLAELVIHLIKGDGITSPAFELVFNSPYYFHGPFGWSGASFHMADESEKIALGRQLGWLADADDTEAAKYFEELTLFEVETTSTGFTVQILASSAYRVDK